MTLKDGGHVRIRFADCVHRLEEFVLRAGCLARAGAEPEDRSKKPPPSATRFCYAFEAAERGTIRRSGTAWLTFVIVGAGATGVELAGALGEIARHTLRARLPLHPSARRRSILILDGSARVLPTYPQDLSQDAEALPAQARACRCEPASGDRRGRRRRAFQKSRRGGTAHRGEDGAVGRRRDRYLVRPHTGRAYRRAHDRARGTFTVKPDLTIPGFPEYLRGGRPGASAARNGKPLPGVAQVAMQGGAYAAKAIVARLNGPKELAPFHYFDKGDLAVIGRGAAVADIFGVAPARGLLAWLVWLFVHLMYLVQFQNRVLVFVQWGIQYVTFSRGARLITGEAVKDAEVE